MLLHSCSFQLIIGGLLPQTWGLPSRRKGWRGCPGQPRRSLKFFVVFHNFSFLTLILTMKKVDGSHLRSSTGNLRRESLCWHLRTESWKIFCQVFENNPNVCGQNSNLAQGCMTCFHFSTVYMDLVLYFPSSESVNKRATSDWIWKINLGNFNFQLNSFIDRISFFSLH